MKKSFLIAKLESLGSSSKSLSMKKKGGKLLRKKKSKKKAADGDEEASVLSHSDMSFSTLGQSTIAE